MKRNRGLAFATILVGVLFAFASCDQSTSTEFSESFQGVKEVTAIPGGQNSKMDLRTVNSDSYFSVTLDDGSTFEGWCIEWNEGAIEGVQNEVNLYSTKGHEAWKEINYFLGIKDRLRSEDPSLTYKEIQAVIWSLIDNPSFDVDNIGEYKNIDPAFVTNGQANFDVTKVKNIVSQVNSYFSLNKLKTGDEFSYGVLIENDGQTILVGTETAFAVETKLNNEDETVVDSSVSTCFSDLTTRFVLNPEFEIVDDYPRWGWTNGPLSEGSYEFEVYAGAGQCVLSKGTLVGKLLVDYNEGTATITYEMTATSPFTDAKYGMTETHLYVGTEPLARKSNGNYTVAPGQYPYQHPVDQDYFNPPVTTDTFTIDGLSGDIFIVAHTVVSGFEPPADPS